MPPAPACRGTGAPPHGSAAPQLSFSLFLPKIASSLVMDDRPAGLQGVLQEGGTEDGEAVASVVFDTLVGVA